MHDLDRAMFETDEVDHPSEQDEHDEFLKILREQMGDTSNAETERAEEGVDQTSDEVALAAEFLDAQNEAELDRFLGKLLSRAAGAARNFARSDTGRALGGILKNAAGQALPVIGRGIGSKIDPKYGAAGERAGQAAKGWLGLELEGLSEEDREFEVARAFVRFATTASRQAAQAPAGTPPKAAAVAAATAAAKRHAPGLLGNLVPGGTPQVRHHSGRWERRGDQIVIFGA